MIEKTKKDFVNDRIFDVEKVEAMERRSPHWLRAKAMMAHTAYANDYVTGYGFPFVMIPIEKAVEEGTPIATKSGGILGLKGWNEVFE